MVANLRAPAHYSFVFGGSAGIGAAMARELDDAGSAVHVFSRSRPDWLDAAHSATWHPLDLNDSAAVDEAIGAALAETGSRVDFLAYSAIDYGSTRRDFEDSDLEEWFRQFRVNLHGLAIALKRTLPLLKGAAPGVVVGVSSEVVYNAGPGRAGYAATKTAAASLLRSIAQEEDDSKLRVVQVLPAGMVDSPGIRRRRPSSFDFSGYLDPECFRPITRSLLATRAEGFAGRCLVVEPDGRWYDVDAKGVASQSDHRPGLADARHAG